MGGIILASSAWLSAVQLVDYFDWYVVTGVWVLLVGAVVLTILILLMRDWMRRRAYRRNPLVGILNEETQHPYRPNQMPLWMLMESTST